MKINSYKKQKNGMYLIKFEDDVIKIHEDLILKHNLLLKKQITTEEKEQLLKENYVYEGYQVSLKYLKTKIRTSKEIRTHLSKKAYTNEDINKIIILLKEKGYLDDNRYIISFIHDKINLSNEGPDKIKAFLLSQDLDLYKIEEALKEFTNDLQKEKVEKLAEKAIKANRNKSFNALKQKIVINLTNLGYSRNIINNVLNNYSVSDKDIYEKEYNKLYKKLSNKYSGKELEYKIKQKMYQKGFNIYE